MANEKRLIDANGKFTLNAGDLTGHIMCVENGYATVFDRFAKVVCKFSLLDAPNVDAVEVVFCDECTNHGQCIPEDTFRLLRIEKPFCCVGSRKTNYFSAKMDGVGNG